MEGTHVSVVFKISIFFPPFSRAVILGMRSPDQLPQNLEESRFLGPTLASPSQKLWGGSVLCVNKPSGGFSVLF